MASVLAGSAQVPLQLSLPYGRLLVGALSSEAGKYPSREPIRLNR